MVRRACSKDAPSLRKLSSSVSVSPRVSSSSREANPLRPRDGDLRSPPSSRARALSASSLWRLWRFSSSSASFTRCKSRAALVLCQRPPRGVGTLRRLSSSASSAIDRCFSSGPRRRHKSKAKALARWAVFVGFTGLPSVLRSCVHKYRPSGLCTQGQVRAMHATDARQASSRLEFRVAEAVRRPMHAMHARRRAPGSGGVRWAP